MQGDKLVESVPLMSWFSFDAVVSRLFALQKAGGLVVSSGCQKGWQSRRCQRTDVVREARHSLV